MKGLSATQRTRLRRAVERRERETQRWVDVLDALLAEGASAAAIGRELEVSRQAVHQLVGRHHGKAGTATSSNTAARTARR